MDSRRRLGFMLARRQGALALQDLNRPGNALASLIGATRSLIAALGGPYIDPTRIETFALKRAHSRLRHALNIGRQHG